MSDNYLDIHNLELTGQPFQAKFIEVPTSNLPPECILPPDGVLPVLPSIFNPPPLQCTVNIDRPLIPLPYICTPTIDGNVSITSCNANQYLTGNLSIQPIPGSDCDFQFGGEIEVCIPCIPTVEGGIGVSSCNNSNRNYQLTKPNDVQFAYNESSCTYDLTGDIEICGPCVPTMNGTITVSAGSTSSYKLNKTAPIQLAFDETTCNYGLQGNIEIDGPCVPSVGGGVVATSSQLGSGVGPAVILSSSPGTFQYDKDSCEYNLNAGFSLAVNCIPVYSGLSRSATFNLQNTDPRGPDAPSANFSVTVDTSVGGSGCEKNILVDISMDGGDGGGGLQGGGKQEYVCQKSDAEFPDYAKTTMELDTLSVNELNFDNACCQNDLSFWRDCGQEFQMVEKDNIRSHVHALVNDNAILESYLTDQGDAWFSFWTKDVTKSNSPSGESSHIMAREVQFTDGEGVTKRALFAVSKPWDPDDPSDLTNANGDVFVIAGGAGGSSCPFDFSYVKDANGNTVGGQLGYGTLSLILPSNIEETIEFNGGLQFVKLAATTDGKNVTAVEVVVNGNQPAPLTTTVGLAPTEFEVLIYVINNGKPQKVIGCENPFARAVETVRLEKETITPGGPAYDIYYSWAIE